MLKYTALGAAVIAVLAFIGACRDENKLGGGAGSADNGRGVCFSPENERAFATGTQPTFTITLTRTDTAEAATVAIHLVKSDTAAIVIPDSVTFAKGSRVARITCRAAGLPAPRRDVDGNTVNRYYSFTIEVDSAHVDPAAKGEARFTASVFNGKLWNTIVRDAYWYFGTSTVMPYAYSDIEQYANENRFRIDNFMGSGVDWEFSINPDGKYTNLHGPVSTWCGYVIHSGDHIIEYEGWLYFSPDADNSVYGWKVPGWTNGYACLAFFPNYSFIDFGSKYFSTWAYGLLDDKTHTNVSGNFYGYWAD